MVGMRVVVLSDTHAPRRWKSCPPAVAAQLRAADLILHAGDVCTAQVLDELSGYAPVRAVAGPAPKKSLGGAPLWAVAGGAVLLGVRGVCVISHGSSSARAIVSAVRLAHEAAVGGLVGRLL